jgi:uncharacterized protein (TIGR03083 family)
VEIDEHIESLRVEGDLLAAAVAQAGPDAPVPTCPDWLVRDLVHHTGTVHRWATDIVATPRATPPSDDEFAVILGPMPSDRALVDWFRDGHATLVDALRAAARDVDCWSFLAAPSPLAFWARRQDHETGMHRVDAQSAVGTIDSLPAAVAADGIDELLTCFVTRRGARLRSDTPRSLLVAPEDVDAAWRVEIADAVTTTRGAAQPADCTIRGAATDLHRLLWNRAGRDEVTVEGDATLLDLWRERVTIRSS